MRYVQSCLNSISFPRDLEQVKAMWLKQSENDGDNELDIDVLLNYDECGTHWWYAPKWIQPGDIMFFFQTGTGWRNAKRLLKQCDKMLTDPSLTEVEKDDAKFFRDLLDYASEILEAYESTIFAIAEVDSLDNIFGLVKGAHFTGGFFAPIKRIHVFDTPVELQNFNDIITISQSTITPLLGGRFTELKQRISEFNEIPSWVLNTNPSSQGFRDIDRANWRGLVSSEKCGFVMEEQVRVFFLDFVMKELADPKLSYFEECNCFNAGGESLGRADYFIRIDGNWYPVEAKIDLRSTDVLPQVKRYIESRSFIPTLGKNTKKQYRLNEVAPICIIGDRNGLYLGNRCGFLVGTPNSPWIRRTEMASVTGDEIKRRFKSVLCQQSK